MLLEPFCFREKKLNYAMTHDGLAIGRRRYSNARPVLRTVSFHGLPISIEIEVGQTKSGIDANGEEWSKTYSVPYGEIPSSKTLADGEGVDVYLGLNLNAPMVYVVHQLKSDGRPDEDKVMLGFLSSGEAVSAYKNHGPSWGFGTLDIMTVDQFLHGYLASNRKL